MKKRLLTAALLLAAAGLAAPLFSANYLRGPITTALESALGRKVEIGELRYNVFTGPGFKLKAVTVAEDPRAGIEPFAYIDSLDARLDLLALATGRLEFSSLRFVDTSVNIVKPDAAPWNFQLLLEKPATRRIPNLTFERSRINLKFGDTKSAYYLANTDAEIQPSADGPIQVRFKGGPARTDRAAQSLGRVTGRGYWKPVPNGESLVDLWLELERSSVSEVVRLLDAYDLGLHGVVAAQAHLSGPASRIEVNGQLQVDDMHRWDLMPVRGDMWKVAFGGTLDLPGQSLELGTRPRQQEPQPVSLYLTASSLLSQPRWEAALRFSEVPASNLLAFARHMGTTLPDDISLEGTLRGEVLIGSEGGMRGGIESADCRLTLSGSAPLELRDARAVIENKVLRLDPSRLQFGEGEEAQVDGRLDLATGVRELRITSQKLPLAAFQSETGRILGASSAPWLSSLRQGTWKGTLRFQQSGGDPPVWSGDWSIQNGTLNLDGFASRIAVSSADVTLQSRRATWRKVRGRAGEIAFDAEADFEPGSPVRFRLFIPRASVARIEQLLSPSLFRQKGFLARTLGLGQAPVPDWLRNRRAEGSLTIGQLLIGETRWRTVRSRVVWEGTKILLPDLSALLEEAELSGDAAVELAGWLPRYSFQGKITNLPYQSGRLDLEGRAETAGSGDALLARLRAEGRFRAREIELSPEQNFRTASGAFELTPSSPRWRLSQIEAQQGPDLYTGQGVAQSDGRLYLELTAPRRQLRLTASLPAVPLP